MTRATLSVIRREYLQRVRTKGFVFGTIAIPLVMVGLIVVPVWLGSRSADGERTIQVLDRTGVLADALVPRLEDAGFTVQEGLSDASEASLRGLLDSEAIGGFLILDAATLERGEARYVTRASLSPVREVALRQALVQVALEARIGGSRDDVAALLAGGELEVDMVGGSDASVDGVVFAGAYIGAFLLYMSILLYAVAVMRSVLEEKTNRVVEVVISSMRPFELMLGKIVGVGAVGLTQIAVWVGTATLLSLTGLPALLAADSATGGIGSLADALPGTGYLVWFVAFFVGGYFMYSGLYAAVGAMCNSDEEAQQAQTPVTLMLVVPIVFVMEVIQNPDSALAVGLSLFPLFSPILMFARAASGAAPLWQILLSLAGMVLAVLAIAWLAGRIYKVGILMAGKRPTLPEIWRWVREA